MLLIAFFLSAIPTEVDADQQAESSLILHRWNFGLNAARQPALWLEFGNHAEYSITLNAVQVEPGSWIGLGRPFNSGEVSAVMLSVNAPPAFVRIRTNEGVFKIDLLPRDRL
jgi:hypothetical protein